jgi:hypothetical protein
MKYDMREALYFFFFVFVFGAGERCDSSHIPVFKLSCISVIIHDKYPLVSQLLHFLFPIEVKVGHESVVANSLSVDDD